MVRKWLHPEYYHADMTVVAKKHMESHVGEVILPQDGLGECNLGVSLLI